MNTGVGQGVDPNVSAEVKQLEQDAVSHGAGQSEDIDAHHLAETPAAEVNDNQHIDVKRMKEWFTAFSLRDVFNQTDLEEFTAVKEMVFDLCDLAQEAGFLKDVQEARQELAGEDERYKVLPNLY